MNKKYRFWLFAALTSVAFLVFTIYSVRDPGQPTFVPPEFDAGAQKGTPDIPSELPYGVTHLGEYKIALATVIPAKEQEAYIYFANFASNNVWMKLRIFDNAGNRIGESGLIKPNEYLEKVSLLSELDGSEITIKVMCYEPDTYHSKGSAQITLPTLVTSQ